MESRDTPFGLSFTERYQLYLNHELEENFFDSIEKMLISVDKKFCNDVCMLQECRLIFYTRRDHFEQNGHSICRARDLKGTRADYVHSGRAPPVPQRDITDGKVIARGTGKDFVR